MDMLDDMAKTGNHGQLPYSSENWLITTVDM